MSYGEFQYSRFEKAINLTDEGYPAWFAWKLATVSTMIEACRRKYV